MDVVCTIFFAKYCCCFYLMLMFSFLIRVCQRCYLYGAVLDKGRSPIPSGKANKQASTLPGKYCTFVLILSHPPRILNGLTNAVLYLYLKSFFFLTMCVEFCIHGCVLNLRQYAMIPAPKKEENLMCASCTESSLILLLLSLSCFLSANCYFFLGCFSNSQNDIL